MTLLLFGNDEEQKETKSYKFYYELRDKYKLGNPILDHYKCYIIKNKKTGEKRNMIKSYPYPISNEDILELANLVKEGYDISIEANGEYSNDTFCINIIDKK